MQNSLGDTGADGGGGTNDEAGDADEMMMLLRMEMLTLPWMTMVKIAVEVGIYYLTKSFCCSV